MRFAGFLRISDQSTVGATMATDEGPQYLRAAREGGFKGGMMGGLIGAIIAVIICFICHYFLAR
jgi:hypothetical protein